MSNVYRRSLLACWFWLAVGLQGCGRSELLDYWTNSAPIVILNAPPVVIAGEIVQIEATVVDPDGDSIDIQWKNLPEGAEITAQPKSSLSVVIWIPKVTQVGEFDFSVEAMDNGYPPRKGVARGRIQVNPAEAVQGNSRFQLLEGPHELAVGDLNGDGILDVVALSPRVDTLEIFLGGHESGQANGTLVEFSRLCLSTQNEIEDAGYFATLFRLLLIDDLDGDGSDDIIVNLYIVIDGLRRNGTFVVPGFSGWKAGEEPAYIPSWLPIDSCAETFENGKLAQYCTQFESLDVDQDGKVEVIVTVGLKDEIGSKTWSELWMLRPVKDLEKGGIFSFELQSRQAAPFQLLEGLEWNGGGIIILASQFFCFEGCTGVPQVWAMDKRGLVKLHEWSIAALDIAVPLFIGPFGKEEKLIGLYRLTSGIMGVDLEAEEMELSTVGIPLPPGSWTWDVARGRFASENAGQLAIAWSPSIGSSPTQLTTEGELTIYRLIDADQGISFEPVRTINNTGGPHGVAAGDFNGDGLDDLAYTLRATNELVVWINPGDL